MSNIVYFSYCDDLTYCEAKYLIEVGRHFVVVFEAVIPRSDPFRTCVLRDNATILSEENHALSPRVPPVTACERTAFVLLSIVWTDLSTKFICWLFGGTGSTAMGRTPSINSLDDSTLPASTT